jgi:hypothetical protein
VAWSAAALGVGFCTGYCLANYVKGDDVEYDRAIDRYGRESQSYDYASQAMAGAAGMSAPNLRSRTGNGSHDSGPGFFQKVANTQAFERVKDEASNIGDAVVQEITKTAKNVVLPALMVSLRNFIGDHLPNVEKQPQQQPSRSYQPAMERNPS